MLRRRLTSISRFLLGVCMIFTPTLVILYHLSDVRMADAHRDSGAPPTLTHPGAFRIVAFGSSTTRGYGASSEAFTYPAQLQSLLDKSSPPAPRVDVINRGVNGEDVDAMLRRLDDDILARHPDIILWQAGSNDALHNHSLQAFTDKLRKGLATMRKAGSVVILIGPQWSPDPSAMTRLTVYAAAMRAVARDEKVAVIDRLTLMPEWARQKLIPPEDLIGPDGIHMTDRGYEFLARAAFDAIPSIAPELRRSTRADAGRASPLPGHL